MNVARNLLVSLVLAAAATGGAVVSSSGESAGAPSGVTVSGEHLCC